MSFKICTKCHEEKQVTDFYKTSDGILAHCKVCARKLQKTYPSYIAKKKKAVERICEWCGTEFHSVNKRKWCDDGCKNEQSKFERRCKNYFPGLPSTKRTCTCCGIEFRVKQGMTSPSGNWFCSKICNKRYARHPIPRAKPLPTAYSRRVSIETKQRRLAKQNAKQAWTYWVTVKAPDDWVERYWHAAGKPWRNRRLFRTEAEIARARRIHDPEFALRDRIRIQNRKLRRGRIDETIRLALKNDYEPKIVKFKLGYTVTELKAHLEKQFTRGMSWEAFGRGEIHIDHIIPQSQFDLTNPEELKACWALSNLQPLWAADNLRKRDKIVNLI